VRSLLSLKHGHNFSKNPNLVMWRLLGDIVAGRETRVLLSVFLSIQ
jgi:hypothetical protein